MIIEMLQLHTLQDVTQNDILLIKLLPSGGGGGGSEVLF